MVKRKLKNKKTGKKRLVKKKAIKMVPSQNIVHRTRIRVIGIGGGGSSIVSEIASQLKRVDFVVANTDIQALKASPRAVRTLAFGQNITLGLGCGMDAKVGQKAAREEKVKIAKLFKDIDLCILVSCLGGGTGSGAAPEFAKIAKDLGIMTFGIFTLPFKFEGVRRAQIARASLDKIIPNLNALAIIPNENIFQIIDKKTPIREAFSAINKKLTENLQGLIEMVYVPGLINIDFADLKTILDGKGKLAYLNSAVSQGERRVEEVVKTVLKSPLAEYNILGAEKIIFNITASRELGMNEVETISQAIANFNKRAKIIFGISQSDSYKDKIRIALLAVGCGKEPKVKPKKVKKIKPPQPKPQPKPKKKSSPKKKSKKKPVKETSPQPVKVEVTQEETMPLKTLTRRNALDLKKAAEKAEQEMLEREKKWDVPAFLRRKPEETQ